jgi:type II secretory pathway component GspD/PulD (secretin)
LLSVLLLSAGVAHAESAKLEQRVYSVADLIFPVNNAAKAETPSAERQQVTQASCVTKSAPSAQTNEDQLIKLITSTIAPHSWSAYGGKGTIDFHPPSMSLVVNQTPDVHEQIADLLAALRRFYDTEVAVEVKFAAVSDDVFQNLKRGGVFGNPKKSKPRGVVLLKDPQVFLLMEAIQKDVRTNVTQAPKMTMFDGQTSELNVGEDRTFVTGMEITARGDNAEFRPKTEVVPLGIHVGLHPVVSADRRSVKLDLDAKMIDLVSSEVPLCPIASVLPQKNDCPNAKPLPFTQFIQMPRINTLSLKRELVIRDGHTAVLTGWSKPCEEISYHPISVALSELPVIGDWFPKVECKREYPTYHILVLVTPRIIVTEETEERQTGYVAEPSVVP